MGVRQEGNQGLSGLDPLAHDWGREQQCRTHNIQHATSLFIMKTNSSREWGKYRNNWPFRWLCYLAYKVTLASLSARSPTLFMGMAWGWRKEKQWWYDEDKDGIQALLLGDFFEGLLWDLAFGLERRSRDVRRASSPRSILRPPASTFLASLKAQKHSSLPPLDSQTSPWAYWRPDQLWCSFICCPEGTCSGRTTGDLH